MGPTSTKTPPSSFVADGGSTLTLLHYSTGSGVPPLDITPPSPRLLDAVPSPVTMLTDTPPPRSERSVQTLVIPRVSN